MKSLLKTSSIVVVVRVLGIALQSGLIVLLASALEIAQMGVFALCYAMVGFARILGPLGMGQTTMRMIAHAAADAPLTAGLHQTINVALVLVVVVNSLAGIAFGFAAAFTDGFFIATDDAQVAMILTAVAFPSFAIIGLLTMQLRGFDRQVWAQIPDSIVLQFVFGASLIGFWSTENLTLVSALWALVFAAWLVAAIYLFSFFRLNTLHAGFDFSIGRHLWSESRDIFAALVVTALSVRAPLFLAAWLLGPAGAAILDIAIRFGTLPSLTTTSVMATFSPLFARLGKEDRRSELSRSLSLSSLAALTPALLFLVLLVAAAPLVIEFALPEAYGEAYFPLIIVCCSQLANAIFGPATQVLLMTRQGSIVLGFSAAQLLVIIVLAIASANTLGYAGIAWTILIAQIVRDFGAAAWASRHMGIALPPLELIRRNG